MLSGEDIICLTLRPWHSTWKTDQKVMSELSLSNRVLYVDPPRSLSTALGEVLHRKRRRPVLEYRAEKLIVYQEPVYLPAWGRAHRLGTVFNCVVEPVRLEHIRRTASRLGFRAPIFWSCNPFASRAIGRLREKLVVYHALDNFPGYFSPNEVWANLVDAAHQEMLRRADVVLAVSESLLEQCLQFNRNSYLLPNGVDYEQFAAAASASDSTPEDVRPIPRPIVGFVGALHSSVDFELLRLLAHAHPEWSLLLVGPVEFLDAADRRTFGELCAQRSVYYLGAKTPEALPRYVRSCDVGLIPNRINAITAYGDSQKLYEYFSCGKPVVSTALQSVRRFEPLARVADSPAAFVAAVEDVLARPDEQSAARKSVARSNSWRRRLDDMSAILAQHMEQRAAQAAATGPAVLGT